MRPLNGCPSVCPHCKINYCKSMLRATSLPNFAGHGHQSQRCYLCNAHCPPAITLVITLQVGKMRAVPHTLATHFTRCHTHSPQPRILHIAPKLSYCIELELCQYRYFESVSVFGILISIFSIPTSVSVSVF